MLTDQIQNAIKYARMGFKVFPAIWKAENKQHVGLCKWSTESSSDPNKIKAWGDLHPAHAYFCVALRQSGYTVIDVDTKGEKQGLATLEDLKLFYGDLPDTFAVQTPSGGYHYIYEGNAAFGANKLGPGVDIPVMIPLPGSIVPGKGEYKSLNGSSITPLPPWVTELAGQVAEPHEQKDNSLIDLDQPHNIEKAKTYLTKDAPPAVEGEGGNDTAYRTLCRVRDYGISEALCLELAINCYNSRCLPPWSDTELKALVKHAYTYAKSPPGRNDPTQDFDPIIPKDLIQFIPHSALTEKLRLPNWLVKGYIEKDTITLFYGDTGAYKSFLAIDIGQHIAAKKRWIGRRTEAGPVIYVAGEGHGGISRRLLAWKQDRNIAGKIPFYVSPHAIHLDCKDAVQLLARSIHALAPEPALIIIDTLATTMGAGDENSTKDMTTFLNYVIKIREALKCAIIIVHHTGHLAKERPRGAYALMAGVDALYLIEKTDEGLTCLRQPGKMKDALKPKDTWFRAKTIKLGVDEDLADVTSLVMEYLPDHVERVDVSKYGVKQQLVVSILRTAGGSMEKPEAQEAFKLQVEELGQEFKRNSFYKAVKSLKERGKVKENLGLLELQEKPQPIMEGAEQDENFLA